MKCACVLPRLFLGPDPRDDDDFLQIRSLNVTAVISLQTEDDLRDRGMAWERDTAQAAGLIFCSVPVTDFDAADLELKLLERVSALPKLLDVGHTVYVHCTAGVSRSPTVAVAYLHWHQAWPLQKALAHVKSMRDCCPNEEVIKRVTRKRRVQIPPSAPL